MSISTRLYEVISNATGRDVDQEKLQSNNMIDELGLTSVDSLEVLIRIEGEFDIMIDDSDLSMDLLGDFNKLEEYVSGKLG
ncbi:Carrier domain-containing protein [Vibrio crassostreae]|nr:Carrier domain-containing protein [Vibrio crassostreae]CAK2773988.1 Carrier domain-containing protein [Vibrio crassostreae]CAK3218111.1 Carrier domain-containing protein [Vibrio crassostreae]CAK3841480.1 Carrier domain-containing protein [Vibrio crassostreae]